MTIESTFDLSVDMSAVLERLCHSDDRVFGSGRVEIVPVSFQVRESSEIMRARVTTATGIQYVYAKIFRPRPGEAGLAATRARYARDLEVTRHVCNAMKSMDTLRAVEVIACYEDLLGVVTVEVTGKPLNIAIERGAAWPATAAHLESLEVDLTRLGRWIAAFQLVAPRATASRVNLDETRGYIDFRLKKLVNLEPAGLSDSERHEILEHFDSRVAEVQSEDLIEVPVHGDIVPSNVVVRPECVTVLDFGMTGAGSKYLDIARLYTQLDFYKAKPQFRPHVVARLQSAALAGFEAGLSIENPLFEINAIQHVVCHLLSHARQPGVFPHNIYSAHQCRRHRRWLRGRVAKRLERTANATVSGVQ